MVLLENDNGNWGAYTPQEGINVYATGSSREEVLARFREGLAGLLEYRRDTGGDIPDVTGWEIYEARETVPFPSPIAA